MSLAAAALALILSASPSAPVRLERLPRLGDLKKAIAPKGRPLLVHVWALWCPPCLAELPLQVELARKASALGVDVLFLNLDKFEDEKKVRAYLSEHAALGVARHVQVSETLDAAAWGRVLQEGWKPVLPATFLYGADGKAGPAFPDDYTPKQEAEVLAQLEAMVKASPAHPADVRLEAPKGRPSR